jgi:hypothetical protein
MPRRGASEGYHVRGGGCIWHVNAHRNGLRAWRQSKCAAAARQRGALPLQRCALANVAADRKLVLIEWLDSRRGEGWVRLEDLESTVTRCRSVGWIVARDAASVTLAGHLGESPEQCCGDLTIPARAILKMIPLSIPSGKRTAQNLRA